MELLSLESPEGRRKTCCVIRGRRKPNRPCCGAGDGGRPCRATTRRKAAAGRRGRQSGRGFLIVRPLRTDGEHNGHKVSVSCLVIREKHKGRVSCFVKKPYRPCCRCGGRSPPMPRHSRAEGNSIRVIADILSSCQAAYGDKKRLKGFSTPMHRLRHLFRKKAVFRVS